MHEPNFGAFSDTAREATCYTERNGEGRDVQNREREGLQAVAIYLRVSTTEQTTTIQRREPHVVDCTHSCLAFNASWIALQSTQSVRAVAVMACDDEIVPLQARIETVGEDADLHEVYDTERHLLYVACTRARDHLLITSVEPASEFLDDLRM
jgi:hypothetical protein